LEPVTDKYVPVKPGAGVRGEPRNGFALEQVKVSPQKVLVRGPQSRVARLQDVTTEPVDISGRTETVVRNVRVVTNDRFVRSIDVREVNVTAVITERRERKTISDVPVTFSRLKPDLSPAVNVIGSIEVDAPVRFLETISGRDLELVADCGDVAGPGEYRVAVLPPELPFEGTVLGYTPGTVTVRFERKGEE
ncbi:MAG TPA: YbbR-like domain-containing protein, partial [Spirochaetia bacterium]|nr:YbbR-like domain-containing protein [Spirochaetia bacterium]